MCLPSFARKAFRMLAWGIWYIYSQSTCNSTHCHIPSIQLEDVTFLKLEYLWSFANERGKWLMGHSKFTCQIFISCVLTFLEPRVLKRVLCTQNICAHECRVNSTQAWYVICKFTSISFTIRTLLSPNCQAWCVLDCTFKYQYTYSTYLLPDWL